MTDTTPSASAPKKRSLFKRAAWQDAPKTEEDIFSHAKDFGNIVAEQNRLQAEKRKQAEEARRKKEGSDGSKRRKASGGAQDDEEPRLSGSGSGSSARAGRDRMGSKAYVLVPPVRTMH